MNLVIDCFKLVKGTGKSIGIYNLTKSLVEYLAQENVRKHYEQHIIVLGNDYNRDDMSADGVQFVRMKGNPLDRKYIVWWELFGVTEAVKKYQPDRVLFPRGFRPLSYKGRDTIIIHDLIPFFYKEKYPEAVGKAENLYITTRLRQSIKGADRVITISQASLDDILKRVPEAAGKVTVIENGINDIDYDVLVREREGMTSGNSESKQADTPEGGYIAAVTSKLPHKNARGIVKAYNEYLKKAVDPLKLMIIGIPDINEFIAEGIISEEAAENVICHAYYADYNEMCMAIMNAKMFLFLSLAEGFGFPPLEAMQLHCPVICSDRSSLPEVVGDAGLLVDPDDSESVAEQIIRLQNDSVLCDELIAKGLDDYKRYSWDSRTPLYWNELFR